MTQTQMVSWLCSNTPWGSKLHQPLLPQGLWFLGFRQWCSLYSERSQTGKKEMFRTNVFHVESTQCESRLSWFIYFSSTPFFWILSIYYLSGTALRPDTEESKPRAHVTGTQTCRERGSCRCCTLFSGHRLPWARCRGSSWLCQGSSGKACCWRAPQNWALQDDTELLRWNNILKVRRLWWNRATWGLV